MPIHIGTTMKLSRESWIILAIGILDLVTTLMWVNDGAHEANPIFQYYLAMGAGWFVLAKFVCLLCPILLFEFAQIHRRQFALKGARIAIAGYLVMYMVGVAKLNPELLSYQKPRASAMLGTMGPQWGHGHIAVADHTFRMPMNVTDSFPLEGIR